MQSVSNNEYPLRYHSLHDNQYLRYFNGHTGRVTTIAMSPKNDMFMSAAEVPRFKSSSRHGFEPSADPPCACGKALFEPKFRCMPGRMTHQCWHCRIGRCGCGTSGQTFARACCRHRHSRAPPSISRCRLPATAPRLACSSCSLYIAHIGSKTLASRKASSALLHHYPVALMLCDFPTARRRALSCSHVVPYVGVFANGGSLPCRA